MIALSDDTKTKFIGEIVFELHGEPTFWNQQAGAIHFWLCISAIMLVSAILWSWLIGRYNQIEVCCYFTGDDHVIINPDCASINFWIHIRKLLEDNEIIVDDDGKWK